MSTTKVYFTLVPCAQAEWEGEPYLNFVLDLFQRQKMPGFHQRYSLVEDVDSADLIAVLEPVAFKTKEYQNVLWSMRPVNRCPNRIFTINQDDAPLAFLPGIYAAMPDRRFEPGFTTAGCYLTNSPNRFVSEAFGSASHQPEHLFIFRGALSSPVRQRMARDRPLVRVDGKTARFTIVDAWFNHTDEQQREYVREILDSKFVLCPRGQGSASHRLFEVMQLGRVPVIIADDWVEPVGPRWGEFSLRVPESKFRSIPKLVSDCESAFPAMAKKAREAWEKFFAPEVRLSWMLDQLEHLRTARADSSFDYRSRWHRRSFYRGNLGTIWGRVYKRFQRRV